MSLQTLIFVIARDQVLLGRKKRGFGVGKYNGYGGKLEPGETIRYCAKRELFEESCLDFHEEDLTHLGYVQFKENGNKIDRRVHIFICEYSKGRGVEEETEEMTPEWFDLESIPYEEMWKDAEFWMPLVFQEVYFEATVWTDDRGDIDLIEIHKSLNAGVRKTLQIICFE